jgi:predicted transcriptional regulator
MSNLVSMTLEVSPELNEKLRRLAKLNGTTMDTMLLKALTLYGIASQAKIDNQRIGVVDANQQLLTEVIGI